MILQDHQTLHSLFNYLLLIDFERWEIIAFNYVATHNFIRLHWIIMWLNLMDHWIKPKMYKFWSKICRNGGVKQDRVVISKCVLWEGVIRIYCVKSCQHDCWDVSWTRTTSVNMPNWTAQSQRSLNLTKRSIGNWGKLGMREVVLCEKSMPVDCQIPKSQAWKHSYR